MNVFDGTGFLVYDYFIACLCYIAATTQAWQLVVLSDRNRFFKFGCTLVTLGWFFWGTRLILDLVSGGDPKIALPGLIGITFLATGNIIKTVYGSVKDMK